MPPVVAAAAITAGATLYGSSKASSAAKKATNAQTAANNAALGEQQREFDINNENSAPWRNVGKGALSALASTYNINPTTGEWGGAGGNTGTPPAPGATNGNYGAFYASPDYQFRLDEGERALTGNYAARGLLGSGSFAKGVLNYGQQAASQEYGGWFGRLSALAGIGQTATAQNAALGQENANQQAGILTNQGQNLASGYATQGGILGGAVNGIGNIAGGVLKNWPTTSAPAWSNPDAYALPNGAAGMESYY